MTANQISYLRAKEEQRHNRAVESWNSNTLQETSRHNKAQESTNWASLTETSRHNQSQEAVNWYTASETARHNQAVEGIDWYNADTLGGLRFAQREQIAADIYQKSQENKLTAAQTKRVNAETEQIQKNLDKIIAETSRAKASERLDNARAVQIEATLQSYVRRMYDEGILTQAKVKQINEQLDLAEKQYKLGAVEKTIDIIVNLSKELRGWVRYLNDVDDKDQNSWEHRLDDWVFTS